MAWQMPPAGQWTAAMGMPQEMNMPQMNIGNYTPEQWAVMQQQNWQQWNQWQQQYSQWQNQYGEKYAQHLQAGQPFAGMPPLPVTAAAPPAPPPPEQPPPPPPPHENNQPLFGGSNIPPVSAPIQRNTSNYSNTKPTSGNNQWSYGTEPSIDAMTTVNREALNKLEEEEKSFDIQFQKWEEEIDRWRKENVNHPDKQAYKEYEDKFELCRAQLLERRQQMKVKRARLMDSTPKPPNSVSATPVAVPPPPPSNTQNNYNQGESSQNFKSNTPQQEYNSQASYDRSNNKIVDSQDRYESYSNMEDENKFSKDSFSSAKSDPSTYLQTSTSGKSIPGLDLVPDTSHNKTNPEIIDITADDITDMQKAPDYTTISKGINNILGDAKIMNILSMVQGNIPPPNTTQNKPNIPFAGNNQSFPPNQGNRNQNNFEQDRQQGNRQNMPYNRQGPNFSMQQSQGMNSQYTQQQGMYNENQDFQQEEYEDSNASFGGPNNRGGPDIRQGGPGMRQGGYDMRQGGNMRQGGPGINNESPDMRYGGPGGLGGPSMRQGGPDIRHGGPDMRQGGPNMRQGGPNMRQGGPDITPGGPDLRQGGPNMRQGGSDMRPSGPNMRQDGPNMRQLGSDMEPGGPNMQHGGPSMMQGGPNMRQGGPNINQGVPNMRQGGPNINQGGPNMRQGGPNINQGGQNMHQGGPNMNQGGPNMQQNLLQDIRPLSHGNQAMEPSFDSGSIPSLMTINTRPLLQDIGSQQNANDYYGSERPMPDNPVINQPPRPKWMEEPLFTPTLVVDYDHKPLRLKARDFIEPVHTFDYNHRSKDEDLHKKRDFEKEVEELFVRKPRREEESNKYVKDLYHREYERRVPREEVRDLRDVRDFRDIRDDYREERDDFRDYTRDRPRDLGPKPREDFERRRIDTDRFDDRRREDVRRDDFRRDDVRRDDFRRDDVRRDDLRRDDLRRDDVRRDDVRRDDVRRDDVRRDDRRDDLRRDDRRDDFRRDDRREDFRERDRERDAYKASSRHDRGRDLSRDDSKHRSRSKETDSRKRGLSKESEVSVASKKSKDNKENDNKMKFKAEKKHIVMIDDLLEPPGRDMRPEKMVIILRGLPGSGKSYLAKLIRDKEAEHGGTARIMSIDDYFMQEGETDEKDPQTGKVVKKPFLKYEYDEASEETYMTSLKRAFKRSLTDGYFSFLIYDAVNDQLKNYADIWNFARQNGFQVYICTMEEDIQTCFKRNIHNRTYEDLEVIKARFFPTPVHHIQLDATTLLQSASITDVHMEDVEDDVIMEDVQEAEVESVFTSKWEKMDDASRLARLDGTSKPLRPSQLSMEDYLQLDDWTPNKAKPGKKTVRWADLEERRKQEKMRAIGFVVGQTDWNRMTDPTMGSSALTQTKYIERVRRE